MNLPRLQATIEASSRNRSMLIIAVDFWLCLLLGIMYHFCRKVSGTSENPELSAGFYRNGKIQFNNMLIILKKF
jgi:hypothetical protein